jgi:putative membrane protein
MTVARESTACDPRTTRDVTTPTGVVGFSKSTGSTALGRTAVGFAVRMLISALGLWLASRIVPGVTITGSGTLLLAALLLGVVNAVVRPVVVFLTLPLTVLTLGLFLWVVNAAMLGLVASLLQEFQIAGLGSALLAAAVVGLTGSIASWYVGAGGRYEVLVIRREQVPNE